MTQQYTTISYQLMLCFSWETIGLGDPLFILESLNLNVQCSEFMIQDVNVRCELQVVASLKHYRYYTMDPKDRYVLGGDHVLEGSNIHGHQAKI